MTTTRLVGVTLLLAACGNSPGTGGQGGGTAGVSSSGAAGAMGTAGAAGSAGSTGSAGTGSGGATSGSAGTGGTATAGSGGGTGNAGAGTGGTASAGRGGVAGGAAGAAGRGGSGGTSLAGWQLLSPMPGGARQEHGVAAASGIVYVIGNFGTAAAARRLEAFDPATGMWSTRAMIPFNADHPNVASANGKIYVLGATGTTSAAEYDPVTDMWTTKRPIPTQRAAAATAAIGSKIYVAGGSMGNNGAAAGPTVRDFAAYDVTTDMWELLDPIPAPERNHGPGAAVGGIFYILGGRTAGPTEGLQNRVDAYDPVARQWSSRAPMPRARGGSAAGVVNGQIIVVGGEGNAASANANRVFPETDVYDPMANTWRTLAPMRTPRHGMGAAGVGDTLYVPGGATAQGGGTAVAILEAFTL
jgi:N-acetylneuraminic acid mutarotase